MTCWLVAGLGYGDCGKGATVDAIVRQTGANLVVRYNGGAQCAHNVVTPEGKHHCFSQFGSGSFVPEVRTYLSRFVLINPVSMLNEGELLKKQGITDIYERTFVDRRAVVITPYQRALNRLQEMSRGRNRHGSTGMGIGVARQDHLELGDAVLFVDDLVNRRTMTDKLEFSRSICAKRAMALNFQFIDTDIKRELNSMSSDTTTEWYVNKYTEWCQQVKLTFEPTRATEHSGIVFEGAQGMLLDEKWGFQPHTTWTDITFTNAETILNEMNYLGPVHKMGVLRSYFTRHGAGPFPSEDVSLLSDPQMVEEHNKEEKYTGAFRVGAFDIPSTLYSLHAIGGVNSLVINHLDIAHRRRHVDVYLAKENTIKLSPNRFLNMLTEMTRTPISMMGYGVSSLHRILIPTEKD